MLLSIMQGDIPETEDWKILKKVWIIYNLKGGNNKMFEKQMRKMKMLDWALAKLGIVAFVAFLIVIWPALRDWVLSVNPWYFLIVSLVAVAIVQIRIWRK